MTYHRQLTSVRQKVRNAFRGLNPSLSAADISEAALLENSLLIGHEFYQSELTATWIESSDEIVIFRLGQLLSRISLADESRRAA